MHERAPAPGAWQQLVRAPGRHRRLIQYGMLVAAVGLPALVAAFIATRSYRAEAMLFSGQRRPVPLADGLSSIPGLRQFSSSLPTGERIRGWYAASRNRAAVVLTHGSMSDRRSVLADATVLAQAGFGVLLFDFPGHGESDGQIRWGVPERQALAATLSFLAKQSELDPTRIGVAGFSLGGVIAAQVAATDKRVAALALIGTPSDLEQQTRWEYRRWGWLTTAPALWALRKHGLDVRDQRPLDLIPRFAPRPVLLITGSDDLVVPPFMAKDLLDAASEPKHLFSVPGAGHGGYLEASPNGYAKTLTSFFQRGLGVDTTE